MTRSTPRVQNIPLMPDDLDTTALPRSGPQPVSTRVATDADVNPLGRTMARAFTTDPVWEFMCGRNFARFEELAVPFYEREVRHGLGHGTITTTEGAHAGALWSPPGKWKLGVVDIAKLAPSATRLFGRRLLVSLATLGETDKVHPTEPHWYLSFLGTDPDHQGRGLGSAVLAPTLARCDMEGTPAYLESSKEANVPFYERQGFEVTGTIDLGKGKGPRMWLMWREPRPPEPDGD